MFANISDHDTWFMKLQDRILSISSTTGISWHITCMCVVLSQRYENCSCLCVSLLIALAGVACVWWGIQIGSSKMVAWHWPDLSTAFSRQMVICSQYFPRSLRMPVLQRSVAQRIVWMLSVQLISTNCLGKKYWTKHVLGILGDFTNHVRKPI